MKITFMGAGSTIFARNVIGDCMCTPSLCESEFALYDIDEKRLKDFKSWDTNAEYGYGLGVRTMLEPTVSGSIGPVGEFGWAGAAGAYMMIDPDNNLGVFYAEHMLNSQEPYIVNRIRNIVYSCID